MNLAIFGCTKYDGLMKILAQGGGAAAFICCLAGWWIFCAIMLAVLDFPFQIPVGDLSQVIRGKSQMAADNV